MTIIKYRPTNEPIPYEQVVKNLAEAYPDYPCVNCKRRAKEEICKCSDTDCSDWAAWFSETWERFRKGAAQDDTK